VPTRRRSTGALANGGGENAEAADAALLHETNPFLAKLLGAFLPDDAAAKASARSLAEDPGDVEAALRKRFAVTMEAATRVMDAIEQLKSGGGGGGGGGDGDGGGNAGNASKQPQVAALNSLLRAENNRLRDQALQDGVKIKQLQSSLAGGAAPGTLRSAPRGAPRASCFYSRL
jgi:hypothetical protein